MDVATHGWFFPHGRTLLGLLLLLGCIAGCANLAGTGEMSDRPPSSLQRARVFLAAGDYRRAIEACQQAVRTRPSAASYVYLTYVYQALDGYLDYQVQQDRWVAVEQLSRNLAGGGPETLLDPIDVMARVAKELIHESAQRESDVAAAMAERLDHDATARLWQQQRVWRQLHPQTWWHGVPAEWAW